MTAVRRHPAAKWISTALLVTAAYHCVVPSASTASITEVIALTGMPVFDGNGVINSVGAPALNDAGQIATRFQLTGTDQGENFAVEVIVRFDEDNSAVTLARQRQTFAVGSSGPVWAMGGFAFNELGQVAFPADLVDDLGLAITWDALLVGDRESNLTPIVQAEQLTPGGHSSFRSVGWRPSLNDAGESAILARLSQPEGYAGYGIFRGGPTSGLVQIVVHGQETPSGDGSFDHFASGGIALNDSGQVAFQATITPANMQSAPQSGVYTGSSQLSLSEVARTGEARPGGDGFFSGFSKPLINAEGRIAFVADYTGASDSSSGVFRSNLTDGTLEQVAFQGYAVSADIGSFESFELLTLSDDGYVAFSAELPREDVVPRDPRPSRYGLFLVTPEGDLLPIAAEGQNTPDGGGQFRDFRGVAMNSRGDLAFVATVASSVDGTANDVGLYQFSELDGLTPIVRAGDHILGNKITGLFLRTNDRTTGNKSSGLDDCGRIGYAFELADGRLGIAVRTPVPDPSTLVSLVLPVWMLASNRALWRGRPRID